MFTTAPAFPFAEALPYPDVAMKVAIAAGIGLLVGLEREWAQKEIGVRTFAIAGLLGMITSLFSPLYVVAALTGILVLMAFLNIHSLLRDRSLELTTSMCLVVVFFLGAMVGAGQELMAATCAIVVIALLAWKFELERFAGALRPEEIRSAVLLGLLSVVIYPLLPDRFVDPWQMLNPRQFWVTVVVIAGIGFANYVLLRLYSTRGLYYAAVLGGLVNSTAAAAELAASFRGRTKEVGRAVSVLLLTNVSMFVRNVLILVILAREAVITSVGPLLVMAVGAAATAWFRRNDTDEPSEPMNLTSPVSLIRVLKFSFLFLVLATVGTLAQRRFGSLGVLVVSAVGGLISSASTTATAAALVTAGRISPETAGIATILTSMASGLVNIPIVHQQAKLPALTRRVAFASILIMAMGVAALFSQWKWVSLPLRLVTG